MSHLDVRQKNMNHLLKAFQFLLITLTLNSGFAYAEDTEPKLSIQEALELAIEKLPEGKEIESIALQTDREGNQWYFAEYGEKVISYEGRDMDEKGEYIPCTKYRKVSVGVKVEMNKDVQIDQISTSGIPRRREILPKKVEMNKDIQIDQISTSGISRRREILPKNK